MASTIVTSIKFHWHHHINGDGILHLENELSHFWNDSKIDVDWDKSRPDTSLQNIIKFIEKTSNIIASKIDYSQEICVKDLHLRSNQTHLKLIKRTFKKVVTPQLGGSGKAASKTLKQEIRVINSDRSRTRKKEEFLRHQYEKIVSLNPSQKKELHIEKAAFRKQVNDWFLVERYKWNIVDIKSKIKDNFD